MKNNKYLLLPIERLQGGIAKQLQQFLVIFNYFCLLQHYFTDYNNKKKSWKGKFN